MVVRAIDETVRQFQKGLPLPTDKRITIEKWGDFIIIQASFGSLVNRTLAILLGYLLSEKTGSTVGVQEDPYRIIFQSSDAITPVSIKDLVFELTSMDVNALAESSLVNTGLFKRRMIHVARKFGAISKMADLSNISLSQLTKSFTGTALYTEAVKDVLAKDIDLENLKHFLNEIAKGEIEVSTVTNDVEASPIAQVGLKKIERQTNIVSSEKMKRLTWDSVRARLLGEVKTFVCTENWDYVETMPVKDFLETLVCPNCGSKKIGVLSEQAYLVDNLIRKKGKKLSNKEKQMEERALKSGQLLDSKGAVAAVALASRQLRLSEIEALISDSDRIDDQLIDKIVDAERKALTRQFW
jgi:ATP-dependent Lhr-like helicase